MDFDINTSDDEIEDLPDEIFYSAPNGKGTATLQKPQLTAKK